MHNKAEMESMTYNGREVNMWLHNGVETYAAIAEDIIAFSATVSVGASASRTNEVIDDTLIESVSGVLNATAGGTSTPPKTASSSAVIFTPTAKALKRYKYAIVTVKACVYANYGSGNATIQGQTVISKSGASQTGTASKTVKVSLGSIGNITAYSQNQSSNVSYLARAGIAVESIKLTNSE